MKEKENTYYLLEDIVSEIQERYNNSLNRKRIIKKNVTLEESFEDGRNMAFYEVLSIIERYMIVFDVELDVKKNIAPEFGKKIKLK